MAMNGLDNLAQSLEQGLNEINVDQDVAEKALLSLGKMLDFAKEHGVQSQGRSF
jgi:quinolinate synthase